jgi:hypothetical protein
MQPHQYPVSGYPPDASWPEEYPPAPAPGGPPPSPVLVAAVPQLLGVWGGRLAFGGRRGGAHLARVAGVFLIYGVQPFVLIGVLNGLAGVFDTDAILPDAAGGPLAAVVTAAIMLGIVQYVAGLAALADPRSELYLRSGGRRPG